MGSGISILLGSGIRILALGSGSQPHQIFWDQDQDHNQTKILGLGIKLLVKNEIISKKIDHVTTLVTLPRNCVNELLVKTGVYTPFHG